MDKGQRKWQVRMPTKQGEVYLRELQRLPMALGTEARGPVGSKQSKAIAFLVWMLVGGTGQV